MTDKAIIMVANQLGTDILPDAKGWKNRIQIRSESSDRLYVVSQRMTDNTWGCSCMGWKSHRNCKHLKAMMPMLAAATKQLAIKGK